ncbi:hypothetical protein PIROE2DRAFT_9672 [Piromyces sp. E2]|nr:hypothetical protein PIROE2DRAFT_9672 [Piromyces sp. E2]|eukprot:OUM63734.1 hypothetical protein PIROE2DRAFT_9672 [Piromyces sp. E2]
MRNYIFIIILIILVLSNNLINAQNKTEVYILVSEPEYPYTLSENFQETYSTLLQEKFEKLTENDARFKNITLIFNFLKFGWWKGSFANLARIYNNYLNDDGYDLMVMDDRMFFNDVSLIETPYLSGYIGLYEPTVTKLMDFKKYVKKEDISFHNSKQFNDGKEDSHIYGLPFEIDFDGLYYHNDDEKAKNILNNIGEKTWDDLVYELKEPPAAPLKIALGVETDLLAFFVEYVNNHYNLTKEYDTNFYDTFNNKTGDDLINGFYNLTHLYTDEIINDSIYLKRDDAFNSFYDRNSTFLIGKASLNNIIWENESDISFSLPPKYTTNLVHKYIVVNKSLVNNKLSAEIYAEIAKVLTSKEMQLFRAEKFGSIPTFDINKKNSDKDIENYCNKFSKMCQYLETINKIYIKDIFKSKYGVQYFEVECFLPLKLRYYLESGESGDFDDHAYIKVISPLFCNLIVFGCSMSMAKPLFRLPPYSRFKIRFSLIYSTLNYGLIYIPMIMVTQRIYRIYKSKTLIFKSLTNKRLMIVTIFLISISTIYRMIIAFSSRVYYRTSGGSREARNNSKKFGDICYVFVVFIINVNDFMIDLMISFMDEQYFYSFYFLLTVYNNVMILVCVYLLVGSRIIVIFLNPNYDKRVSSNDNIKNFIPLNLSIMSTMIRDNENSKSINDTKLNDTCTENKNKTIAALPLDKRDLVEIPPTCSKKINQLFMDYSFKGYNAKVDGMNDSQINIFACNSIDFKVCEEFYYIDYFTLPECKTAKPSSLARLMHYKSIVIETVTLRCTKDENNKNCPLSYDVTTDAEIYQTCKSSICTSGSITYYNAVLTLNKDLEKFIDKYNKNYGDNETVVFSVNPKSHENIRNFLKSSKCDAFRKPVTTSKPKPTTTTTTTTVKPKPTTTTTTTTVKPKPTTTTTTTTVKPKPTTTTTTTTVKPKPTTTTTTTTVKPKPTTTTTTTTTVKPKPTTTTTIEPEPTTTTTTTTTTVEPKPTTTTTTTTVEPKPTTTTTITIEPEPTTIITTIEPEPTTSVSIEPELTTSVVVKFEPTTSIGTESKPTTTTSEPSDDELEIGSDVESEKTKKHHKCFVKHRKN